MDHKRTPLRPSLTALAAVLVLSATPAFAQITDAGAASPAPVTIAPPAPVLTPAAPVTTAPEAPAAPTTDSTSNMSAQDSAAPTPAAAVPVATRSPVVVHTTADTSDTAPVAAAPVKVARSAKPAPTASTSAPTPAPAPTPVAKVTPAPAAPAPTPQPEAAPAQPAPAPAVAATNHDDTALYAGLGGAALLLIGGGAYAVSRRRKHEDELAYTGEDYVAAEPVVVPAAIEPSYEPAVASVATPITETAPIGESRLPNGFDLSRFGPHTQAAYRGPTEDNPSLSLKKRLKIASFRDGRLRQGLEADVLAPVQQAAEEEAPARSLLGGKLSDKLSFRPSRPRPSFRPATA